MPPLLKRIALNGSLTAVLLAVIGVGLTELAGMWLAGQPVDRVAGPAPATQPFAPLADSLRSRVPLVLAAWGFAFVAVGEVLLHLWHKRRPVPVKAEPAELAPDPAEVLLEELLRQVEAQQAKPADPAPTPSPVAADNSPTPEPVPGERPA